MLGWLDLLADFPSSHFPPFCGAAAVGVTLEDYENLYMNLMGRPAVGFLSLFVVLMPD
jgi:hypothetical protein